MASYYQLSQTRGRSKTVAFLAAAASAITIAVLSLFPVLGAHAADGYSLEGGATSESDGVHLVSNTTEAFSNIDFDVVAGTTVNDISELGATFNVLEGDCGGGSLRYTVHTTSGNIFVYFGEHPNFTNCVDGDSGNLLNTVEPRVDTSQVGGTFYDTWANAQTLVGTDEVTGISLNLDSGWQGDQEFVITEANVNGTTISFVQPEEATSKEECKNGGWMNFQANYKNQGQCIASVVSNSNSKHHRE